MLSTSFDTCKTFFIRRFILIVIDNISYQKPFVVSVPVLCFQMFIVKLIL